MTIRTRPPLGRETIPTARPESTRWSLLDLTACRQQGFLRPCQARDAAPSTPSSFPLSPICASVSEAVLVVDDDADLRAELVELVETLGYRAVACGSATDVQEQAGLLETGCVLLDIKLPGQDGVAVQEWLNTVGVSLPVIFVSGVQDVATVVHCMKGGAFEFLQKPIGEMALRRAINSAVGLSRKRSCHAQSRALVAGLIARLTPTELFVARMISKGYPTKLIAAEMQRSENTVKIHRHRIFNKLMVNSAASVANIMRHGDEGDGVAMQVG